MYTSFRFAAQETFPGKANMTAALGHKKLTLKLKLSMDPCPTWSRTRSGQQLPIFLSLGYVIEKV